MYPLNLANVRFWRRVCTPPQDNEGKNCVPTEGFYVTAMNEASDSE